MELVKKIDEYNDAEYVQFKGTISSVFRNAGFTKKDEDGEPTDESKAFARIAVDVTFNGITQTIDGLAYENSILVLPHAYEVGRPMEIHLYTGFTSDEEEHDTINRGFTLAQLPARPGFEDILAGFGFTDLLEASGKAKSKDKAKGKAKRPF